MRKGDVLLVLFALLTVVVVGAVGMIITRPRAPSIPIIRVAPP